uniref:Uncharacterized protein n=1 Tax=Arundo donax TaxID=35708 RepID=A0A0A9HQ94_ARUDO
MQLLLMEELSNKK